MRQETEKYLSVESVACNSCCLFSKGLLQQCGEDVHSAESIIGCLEANSKERMHTCMARGEKTLIVCGCGKGLRGARLSLPALFTFTTTQCTLTNTSAVSVGGIVML